MKANIHPEYGPATIQCACGNTIETRSTVVGTIHVDICSACHPFFTGRQKLMDTAGRIDRFNKKFGTRVATGAPKQPKAPAISSAVPKPAPAKLSLKEKLQAAKEKAASKLK